MRKANVLWIILDLIFLVIFNAVFFVAGGFEHKASVWISYGFIHFAYLMLLITPMLVRKGKSAAVFGFALSSISSAYFLIEFVVGVIFILISPDGYRVAFLVQLCIAGLYGGMLISHMIANERTADAEQKRQHEIYYVKNASAEIVSFMNLSSDREVKRKVEKVYDAINSSPVKSNPNLASTETQILVGIRELEYLLKSDKKEAILQQSDTLLVMINERNRQLKMLPR